MTRLVLLALSWSAPAPDSGPEVPAEITVPAARDHFAAGMGAWLEEDYPRAQRELEAAFALDPAPVLLYSLGQLSRLQGDCARARERFLAFLDTNPPEAAATDTRVNLERCRPAEPIDEPPIEPIDPVEPDPNPVPPRPEPKPDTLGVVLTSVGAVVAGVGVGVFGGAFAVRGRADDAFDVATFERGVRRADAMYWSGVALMSVGTAVLVGGIVRLVLVRKRSARTAGQSWQRLRTAR